MDTFPIHMIDSIATTATYADDLDDTVLLFGNAEVEYIVCSIEIFHTTFEF